MHSNVLSSTLMLVGIEITRVCQVCMYVDAMYDSTIIVMFSTCPLGTWNRILGSVIFLEYHGLNDSTKKMIISSSRVCLRSMNMLE